MKGKSSTQNIYDSFIWLQIISLASLCSWRMRQQCLGFEESWSVCCHQNWQCIELRFECFGKAEITNELFLKLLLATMTTAVPIEVDFNFILFNYLTRDNSTPKTVKLSLVQYYKINQMKKHCYVRYCSLVAASLKFVLIPTKILTQKASRIVPFLKT